MAFIVAQDRRRLIDNFISPLPRDMPHVNRTIRETQQEVVVLAAIPRTAESARNFETATPNDKKVPRIHAAQKKAGRPRRLEDRLDAPSCPVEAVLVGIEQVGIAMLQGFRRVMQGIARQHVVVKKCKILAVRPRGHQV